MKKIRYMDTSFRDGFQSCYGARVKTDDFLPALIAAKEAGGTYFEVGGGARFEAPFLYCQENAFDMMDRIRKALGNEVDLQSLSRGLNVVGLKSQSRDIIDLHAKLFKKHGISTIRNFDALNDVRNLAWSGACIKKHGLTHEITITLMGLPPGLDNGYPHSPKFYLDTMQKIMDAGVPFDRVALKDASGTATPHTWFETAKGLRKMLPAEIEIHAHTHCTADNAISCYRAAIEGGATIIDLSMKPTSGGTASPDILSMWHNLRGTEYTLDIDPEKIIKVEETFKECMSKYMLPPEALEVNPMIPFCPLPGGALTANTQMMRDNDCLDKFPEVIKEMREVVAKGGFGTSVTPVSQFYFQQAFSNVIQGKWKKITEGYGKMVLGYFGKTPGDPDPEIIKLAAEQLKLEPTTADIHDLNDKNPALGIEANRKVLKENNLPDTEENIFLVSTLAEKGIAFLQGKATLGVRYKEEKKAPPAPAAPVAPKVASGVYTVNVEGKTFTVQVAAGGATAVSAAPTAAAPAPAAPATHSGLVHEVPANAPGTVVRMVVNVGDTVTAGQEIIIAEAMKMKTPIVSDKAGKVLEFLVAPGDKVKQGDPVAVIG